jgi:hypothetical protein
VEKARCSCGKRTLFGPSIAIILNITFNKAGNYDAEKLYFLLARHSTSDGKTQ